jgi:hypothetical protein
MSWLLKILIGLLVLNLLWLNFTVLKRPAPVANTIINQTILPTPTAELFISAAPTATAVKPTIHTKRTTYLPIPGSGSVLDTNWTDILGTDFYFSTADFPGLKEAYFEANFRLFNGNGLAFLRLFDVTHGVELWGSQIQTSSQPFITLSSGNITFRPGNNLLRVQAKSLTADTTVFNSGRLKIISLD